MINATKWKQALVHIMLRNGAIVYGISIVTEGFEGNKRPYILPRTSNSSTGNYYFSFLNQKRKHPSFLASRRSCFRSLTCKHRVLNQLRPLLMQQHSITSGLQHNNACSTRKAITVSRTLS